MSIYDNIFNEQFITNKAQPTSFKMGGVNCSTHTINQLLADIYLLLENKTITPRTILCINAHIYNMAYNDIFLRDILNSARIVAADGASIIWGSRIFNNAISERCNMTEAFRAFLMDENVRHCSGIIIGNTDYEAMLAANKINKISYNCKILKSYSGFLSDDDYKKIFNSLNNIDFIFLGMSTPRSEKISEIGKVICPKAIVWHIGAGTIKILAGTMREAPEFMRRHSLQWLHRLTCNPLLLWHRYLVGNPLFFYRIIKERFFK
jgi:N-acetylglucosaminyldiphosphoundecaprenol N-acetyl-beta-D-mannosaminyltransferase